MMIGGLQQGAVIKFADVTLPSDCNEFVKRMATPDNYAGQLVRVRLDSPTGEVICEFNQKSTGGWENFTEESLPLKRTLKKGTYDIYVEFVSSGMPSTNFLWFGFGENPEYN